MSIESPESTPHLPSENEETASPEQLEQVQSQMVREERTTLKDRFKNASGKIRALASAFVLSSALSGGILHAPEREDSNPEKANAPVAAAMEEQEAEEEMPMAEAEPQEEREEIDPDGSEARRVLESLPDDLQEENSKGASRFLAQVQQLPEEAEIIESKDNADIYSLGEGEHLTGRYAVVDERYNQIIIFESKSPDHASVWGREFVAFNPSMDRAFKKAMQREKRLADQGLLEVGAYKDSEVMKTISIDDDTP